MADFSHVSVSEDSPGHVALAGKASGSETVPVSVTVTVEAGGESDSLSFQSERTRTADLPTVIASVSDDQGGTWTVAADGQSAQLS